jgi:hypothetical protein
MKERPARATSTDLDCRLNIGGPGSSSEAELTSSLLPDSQMPSNWFGADRRAPIRFLIKFLSLRMIRRDRPFPEKYMQEHKDK